MYLREIEIFCSDSVASATTPHLRVHLPLASSCITSLYIDCIHPHLRTDGIARALVELMSPSELRTPAYVGVQSGHIRWPFDYNAFLAEGDPGRREYLANTLHDALLWLAAQEGWDQEVFVRAWQEVRDRGFRYEGWLKRRWLSRDRKNIAAIHYEMDMEWLTFDVQIRNRRGQEVFHSPLGRIPPTHEKIQRRIDKVKWLTDQRIMVHAWDCLGGETWRIRIPE